MAKLISCALLVLQAMTELGSPALAQVPGGAGEAVCQQIDGGFVSSQDGGTFPVGPAECGLPGSEGIIVVQPYVLLGAIADASLVNPEDASSVTALVALRYDFTVTGGTVGDMVPVLVHTHLDANVDPSSDAENANVASASINLFGLSGGRIVSNGPSMVACAFSPVPCGFPDAFDGDLALTMASGSAERVFLQILVASSVDFNGISSGQIDPFIFVDPRFPNAADYTITVANGVANANAANASPVPEPSAWALLLAGLGGLSAAAWRRRA